VKTPLAALAADARWLRERSEVEIAHDIGSVAEAMSRHVDRELARARPRHEAAMGPGVASRTAGTPAIDG
jgi:hypothetical protein